MALNSKTEIAYFGEKELLVEPLILIPTSLSYPKFMTG
jgi:hypothetical protein